jgi:multidrug efflux pump
MIISNTAISNRIVVWILMILIIVSGVYSYVTLPKESFPDIPIPNIIVTTSYEGVSPEDIESLITLKIEKEMAGVKGSKEITSTSAEGMSTVVVEFYPDIEIEDALQHVKDKVDQARGELPDDAEEPTIKEISLADFPVMTVSISGDISPVRLKSIADALEDAFEEIPGVLECDISGELEREIRLEIDHDRFTAYGLTADLLLGLVPLENQNISAGSLDTPGTEFNVRVPSEFSEPADVEGLILAVVDGKPVYLTDVAKITDTFKDRMSYSRLNGQPNITLDIKKRIGEDIIPIAATVRQILDEARKQAPRGVEFKITSDLSKDVYSMLKDLENNIISGLILVVLALLLFLGLRTSLIVGLAIPMSMLISFSILDLWGLTLNTVVLFGLIMALGMLVDNAIVIVENIYRHRQMGYGAIEAARLGVGEVAWPVITSTATTIAAFSPLLFWPDIMGEFMSYLPKTLIVALISSLFVALVINPVISATFPGRKASPGRPPRGWFLSFYRKMLRTVIEYRVAVLNVSLLILIGVIMLYGKMGHGVELFPEFDPPRATISLEVPQGTSLDEINRIVLDVEKRLIPYQEYLQDVVARAGVGGGNMFSSASGQASIDLVFYDYIDRIRPSNEIIAEIRDDITDLAGVEIEIVKEEGGPPTGAAVNLEIVGADFDQIKEANRLIRNAITPIPGLVSLKSDLEITRPEISFKVDRQRAKLLGVNTAVIGNFLKTAIFGSKVSSYREYKDEYDITVRLPQDQRLSVDDLKRIQIPNITGGGVPLSSLGSLEYTGGMGTIRHKDQHRVITITGDAEGRLGNEVLADVQESVAKLDLPNNVRLDFTGEQEEQEKASSFLSKAFMIAIFAITMILVAQFNSLLIPLIIMTTVVLSLIGVFTGLLVFAMPFSIIMTGVGVISLAGVVVNNAIVLLHYTRHLENQGMKLIEAAVEAGTVRLRPVLLSSGTTILGLTPMATGISYDFRLMEWVTRSESSQFWASMAIAVIFGLAFATLLTLFVVPTLYVTLRRLKAFLSGKDVDDTVAETE